MLEASSLHVMHNMGGGWRRMTKLTRANALLIWTGAVAEISVRCAQTRLRGGGKAETSAAPSPTRIAAGQITEQQIKSLPCVYLGGRIFG